MAEPRGTIAFVTVGVPTYGFDIFSVELPAGGDTDSVVVETRHTDGVSVNFNGQFLDNSTSTVAFVSERSGSARLYRTTSPTKPPQPLPAAPGSLFHDRPTVRRNKVYFTSVHERPEQQFKSWSAVYSADLDTKDITRLTPRDTADLSPAVSPSGDLVAVASYGSGPWKGDFHELQTELVVFSAADPHRRSVVAPAPAGWPAWAGESTLFFHRTAEDGWWSVFRVDVKPTPDGGLSATGAARRITPSGVHAFTPAAAADGRHIAVATRRKGRTTRQIEIFDLEAEMFIPVTELINPDHHHYNPFFSPCSVRLGYHRFRGESAAAGQVVPHLETVQVPEAVPGVRLLRVYGTFPSFSPDGNLLSCNGDFLEMPGLMLMKADGSRRWVLSKDSSFFYTCWSPTEKGVLYTSVGPIFESSIATVQVARVKFDPNDLLLENACDQWKSLVKEVDVKVKLLSRVNTGNNAFPSCSPDGKWIVFRSGRSGQKNLYIVDAVAGETGTGDGIRRLTEGDWIDTMPAWSPTDDLIAFSSNRHRPDNPNVFSIYLVRPDGTGLRRVYVAGPEGSAEADRERINHVCFSPDGNWLLFTANFGAIAVEPISMANHFQPYGDLYICRLDGSGLTRLTYNGYENGTPAWHRTGDGLDLGSLKLADNVGEPLKGQFEEPLWLTCDL